MQLKDLLNVLNGKLLLLSGSLLLLVACSNNDPQVVVQTEYVENNVAIQQRPARVRFPSVDWYVVTEDNMNDFLQRLEADTGNTVFFAITPRGYENLSLGIADLRRYILDQQAIIIFYEESLQR